MMLSHKCMAVIILALLVVSCGSKDDGGGGGGDSGCPKGSVDEVSRLTRVVRARIPCPESDFEVTQPSEVPDGTHVRARDGGKAKIDFESTGTCNLDQGGTGKVAHLETRSPAGALFDLIVGRSWCTLRRPSGTEVQGWVCAGVTVESTDPSSYFQALSTCDPDPVIEIAVYRGSAVATLESGQQIEIGEGEQLDVFPEVSIGIASFSAEDIEVFRTQAEQLGIEPTQPTSISVIPPEPPSNVERPTVDWLEKFTTVGVVTIGVWTGTEPLGFTYQWQGNCDAQGEGCLDIADATDDTLRVSDASACPFLRVVVTATNEFGSGSAASEPLALANCVE